MYHIGISIVTYSLPIWVSLYRCKLSEHPCSPRGIWIIGAMYDFNNECLEAPLRPSLLLRVTSIAKCQRILMYVQQRCNRWCNIKGRLSNHYLAHFTHFLITWFSLILCQHYCLQTMKLINCVNNSTVYIPWQIYGDIFYGLYTMESAHLHPCIIMVYKTWKAHIGVVCK